MKIETGNEKKKTQNKIPHQFTTLPDHLKTKYLVLFCFPKREKTYVITLEVYSEKALEVYNVKVLDVYNVKALEVSVLLLKLEVFIYVSFIQVLEILCV